jgi:choline dehydrogenase
MRYHLLCALASTAIAAPAASSYDYIVVGSGPGGGPLAADLARAGYSTLLIEAGGDEGENPTYADIANFNEAANDETTRWDFWVKHSDDPARDLKFQHTTWDTGDGTFYVGLEPPEGAKLLGIQYPRAAVLGGCAMHNAGVCSMPADDDWNIIVNKTGDTSWSAENMRKYLKKIERNEYLPAGNEAHGYNGEPTAPFPLPPLTAQAGWPPLSPTTRGPRTTACRVPRCSASWPSSRARTPTRRPRSSTETSTRSARTSTRPPPSTTW